MTTRTAKASLAALWFAACIIFLVVLVLKTPKLGPDATEVWKTAPTLIAPILALVTSFLFGSAKAEEKPLENKIGFAAALAISVAHIVTLFISIFAFRESIAQNVETAGLFMHYFSALTIGALNYFFMGVAVRRKLPATRTPPRR